MRLTVATDTFMASRLFDIAPEASARWDALAALLLHADMSPGHSGRAALAALEEGRVDLLLLDGRMADVDGIEVLGRVHQDPRTCRLPVIVVSADVLPASVTRALAAGADAYIGKPLDFDEVVRTVERVLHFDDEAWAGARALRAPPPPKAETPGPLPPLGRPRPPNRLYRSAAQQRTAAGRP